jgi:peptidoglycan pentaglycine glycine transferase (the first glycine)
MNMDDWNDKIAHLPGASILQTQEWAEIKRITGWEAFPQLWRDEAGEICAAAMVLERTVGPRRLPLKARVLYIPRGPLMDWQDISLRRRVLDDLQALAHKRGAIFLKMDPEVMLGWGIPGGADGAENPSGHEITSELKTRGWLFSDEQIQFRNTVILDLQGGEDEWLARMKQKTRYNLRLAQRKGVSVRVGTLADLGTLYTMYAETSLRDGFVIRPETYYRTVWKTFIEQGICAPLIAEVDGQAIAGLVLFTYAGKAWYIYGMSRDENRDKMPNYLLQWEAMRLAKARNAIVYDLWGAPEVFDESDSMWGVFRFKEGLGGKVIRTMGAWDYPTSPILYRLYTRILPRLLDVMRSRGKDRTRKEVSV